MIETQIPYIAIVVCIALLATLTVAIVSRIRRDTGVHIRKPFFDGSERSFYGLLDVAVREHFCLFRNPALGEVLFTDEQQRPMSARFRKARFDILLCERRSLAPRCAILLADRSTKKGRRRIDQMRGWFDKAGLPLLVYETGGLLDVRTLRDDVYIATGIEHGNQGSEVIGSASVRKAVSEQPKRPETRVCGKCGGGMARHTLKQGKHAGREAWICSSYPECRTAVMIPGKISS